MVRAELCLQRLETGSMAGEEMCKKKQSTLNLPSSFRTGAMA